jgi:hypothetical protein
MEDYKMQIIRSGVEFTALYTIHSGFEIELQSMEYKDANFYELLSQNEIWSVESEIEERHRDNMNDAKFGL